MIGVSVCEGSSCVGATYGVKERFRENMFTKSSFIAMVAGRSRQLVCLLFCECQLAVQVKGMQHTLLRIYLEECKSLFAKSLTACNRYRGNGRAGKRRSDVQRNPRVRLVNVQ